ncbi:MAG: hypothetical protein LBJ67_04095 [Planctomycetaceae bacterium]|jgi:hypothetical protein|nr:hypothetical protein [Planctomycetaceae bacterium]
MNNLSEIFNMSVTTFFDVLNHVNMFFTSLSEVSFLPESGNGAVLVLTSVFALAMVAVTLGDAAEGVFANIRRWHGSIDDQFSNIDNLVNLITEYQAAWQVPPQMLSELTSNRDQLQTLINKCRTSSASTLDRTFRSTLLKSTVGYCLLHVKVWAYGQFTADVMSADDVHLLGFLLPGEHGGPHARKEATDVTAEVKVSVINEDFIRVVIDQSAGENAAQVVHGWPTGVRNALIVIIADDGKTEVLRRMTTRLHNDIQMPEGSRGKLFIIKASFLKHIDDEPRFGNEPTFSMPLTTEDLAAALDRQHHEDVEAQMKEVEIHRQEIERLQNELNEKK